MGCCAREVVIIRLLRQKVRLRMSGSSRNAYPTNRTNNLQTTKGLRRAYNNTSAPNAPLHFRCVERTKRRGVVHQHRKHECIQHSPHRQEYSRRSLTRGRGFALLGPTAASCPPPFSGGAASSSSQCPAVLWRRPVWFPPEVRLSEQHVIQATRT